jgi:hypothetical protein
MMLTLSPLDNLNCLNTTTNSVITASRITAGIRTTGSDDPSLPVLGSDN